MRLLLYFIVLVLITPAKSAQGQSFADELLKIRTIKQYSIRPDGQLELLIKDDYRAVGKLHAKRVKYLSAELPDDLLFPEIDLSKYPNLKFLLMDLEYEPPYNSDYNGRLHFDENVGFSGGLGFIPYLWPGGLASDTNLLLISINKACAYPNCVRSVILSLPSDLINNKNIRWFDAQHLSVHYIPENIDQWGKLEVFALSHEGEIPFIPLNFFRCQRLSFLCLNEKDTNRPEFVFIKKMHPKGKSIDITGYYDSADIEYFAYPYSTQSNLPLIEIKTTTKVEIHSDDKKCLIVSGQITNGLLEGKWELWHSNGKPAQERYYIHGKETGVWRAWDTTGFLKAEYFFTDTGRTEVTYTKYVNYLTIKNILSYNTNGLADGKWIIEMRALNYWRDYPGHTYLYIEQNYTNGQQQGISYYKFEDGTGQEFLMKDGRVISKKDY